MFNPYDMQSSPRLGLPQNSTSPGMGSLGVGGGIYGNPFQVNQFSQPSGLTLQNPYSQQGMGMGMGQRYPEQTQQQMQQGMNQNPMGFMGQPQQGMGLMGMFQPQQGQRYPQQMSQGMNQSPYIGQQQIQQGQPQLGMGMGMGQPPMPPPPSPLQPNASMQQGRGAMLNQPMNTNYGISALNPSNYMSQR
jgi:hypothetical protein